MINIRLVQKKDDGGIRQSERQYIPALKNLGVKVIGVVIGDDYGNYSDQREDFTFVRDIERVDFIGSPLAKVRKLFKSIRIAQVEASRLGKELQTLLGEGGSEKVIS